MAVLVQLQTVEPGLGISTARWLSFAQSLWGMKQDAFAIGKGFDAGLDLVLNCGGATLRNEAHSLSAGVFGASGGSKKGLTTNASFGEAVSGQHSRSTQKAFGRFGPIVTAKTRGFARLCGGW